MGFYSDRDSEPLAPLSTPEDSGRVILGPAESMVAGWDAFRATRVAGHEPMRDRYIATLEALSEQMPDDLEVLRGTGIVDGRTVAEPLSTSGVLEGRVKQYEPQIRALKAKGIDIQTADEAFSTTVAEAKDAEARAARAMGVPGFLGTAAAAMTDPVNIASMFLGPGAEARVLTRILAQAGINAGAEAVSQVGHTAPYRQSLGLDWTPRQAAVDVAAAGVGGAAFEALGIGAARAYRAATGAGKMVRDSIADAAADAIEENVHVAASNPFPNIPGAAAEHLTALREATAAFEEGRAVPSLGERLTARLEAARVREGELTTRLGEAEAGVLGAGAPTMRAKNFANDVARPGLAEAFGTPGFSAGRAAVESVPIKGGVRLSVAGKTLDITDAADPRATLDAFTEAEGLPRVPLSKREALVAERDAIRAGIAEHSETVRQAELDATRRIGDSIGQHHGKPFRTAKDAEKYAKKAGIPDFEVGPRGPGFRGFVVRLKPTADQAAVAAHYDFPGTIAPETAAIRGAGDLGESAAALAERLGPEDQVSRAVREAIAETGDPAMTVGEVQAHWEGRATGEGPVAADALPSEDQAVVDGFTDDELRSASIAEGEGGRVLRDSDGAAQTRTVGEIMDEADEEIAMLRSIKACAIGGE